jgi:nucleoid-associated protein YgaU
MSVQTAVLAGGSTVTSASSARPQLARAQLRLHEVEPGGGQGEAALGTKIDSIDFHFNPKELSLQKSARWERAPARSAPRAGPAEFKGADPCKLTVEMFFDEAERHDGSVVASVEKLLSCCMPTAGTKDTRTASPPLVVFSWGSIVGFPAFVTQVSARYTLFSHDGTPLRATCSVSLEELAGQPQRQNPTSGSLAARRRHTVVEGDSLALLAHREYGDTAMWRALAAYNGIDDPMRVGPGTELLVPAPEDLLATGG